MGHSKTKITPNFLHKKFLSLSILSFKMVMFESQLDLATQLDFFGVVLEAVVSKICEGYKEIGKTKLRSLQVLDINQIKPPTKKRQRKVSREGKFEGKEEDK